MPWCQHHAHPRFLGANFCMEIATELEAWYPDRRCSRIVDAVMQFQQNVPAQPLPVVCARGSGEATTWWYILTVVT